MHADLGLPPPECLLILYEEKSAGVEKAQWSDRESNPGPNTNGGMLYRLIRPIIIPLYYVIVQ